MEENKSLEQEEAEKEASKLMEENDSLILSDAKKEASIFVSPYENNIPVHSTGAAVDVSLFYKCMIIDMGLFGVIWGGDTSSVGTFSENITDEQKEMRLLLLMAATDSGLINYLYEYWHFSLWDRYWSFWMEKNPELREAKYGAVNLVSE